MLKKIMFAVAPLCVITMGLGASVNADDNLLDEIASLDASSINVADVEIEDMDFDLDVDALTADAGEENEVDALEACYRRFYRSYHGGCHYRSHYRSHHCYSNYSYYTPRYYSYRPVYTYCYTPVYSHYWGCY